MTTHTPPRYALVGTGHRAEMYVQALLTTHSDAGQLVAWCDPNEARMQYYDDIFRQLSNTEAQAPTSYHPHHFDQMLTQERPDALIITTPDYLHSEYICRSLENGLSVISEKPLTTDGPKARAIADAVQHSSGNVIVTFNYRYSPRNAMIKQLIHSGEIGTVTSVHFEWLLDTAHGADYFRRWHRESDKSGGLLVHKGSHHFDLVNWWLADTPTQVTALGGLRFYGSENAQERGEQHVGETSRDLPSDDPFRIDMSSDARLRRLYLDAEHIDGYQRDKNVFSDPITIADTMNVLVGYQRGAQLSYSLHAYAPWEGYRVAINGTAGRIELDVTESSYRLPENTDIDPSIKHGGNPDENAAATSEQPTRLRLQHQWEPPKDIPIGEGEGDHGGGDVRLLDDIFRGSTADPLRRQADWAAGLRSVAIGICANNSMVSHQTVDVSSLELPLSAMSPCGT